MNPIDLQIEVIYITVEWRSHRDITALSFLWVGVVVSSLSHFSFLNNGSIPCMVGVSIPRIMLFGIVAECLRCHHLTPSDRVAHSRTDAELCLFIVGLMFGGVSLSRANQKRAIKKSQPNYWLTRL